MTRYAKLPDERVSKAVSEYLDMLTNHPDCESDVIKKASRRLSQEWQELMQRNCEVKSQCESTCESKERKILH